MLLAFLPCFGILKSPGFFFSNPPAVHRFDVGAHRGVLATAPRFFSKGGGGYVIHIFDHIGTLFVSDIWISF